MATSKDPRLQKAAAFQKVLLDFLDYMMRLTQEAKAEGLSNLSLESLEKGRAFLVALDVTYICEKFIQHSYVQWDAIYDRKEEELLNAATAIFSNFSSEDIKEAQNLFNAKTSEGELFIDQEARDGIWDFFHQMIKCSLEYLIIMCQLDGNDAHGLPKFRYGYILPDKTKVNLSQQVQRWKII